jgi:TonB family protein
MKLFTSLMLVAVLACLFCAALTPAQSGRKKHGGSPGAADAGETATNTQDGGAAQDDKVYTAQEVTQKARITRKPLPNYPREARRDRVRGTVRLRIILRADGHVDDHIEVLASLPDGATEESIRVAKLIEFEPAEKDGHKVAQYVIIEYGFNIY